MNIELSGDELEFVLLAVGQAWEERRREGWLDERLYDMMDELAERTNTIEETTRLFPDPQKRLEHAVEHEGNAMRKLIDAKRELDRQANC